MKSASSTECSTRYRRSIGFSKGDTMTTKLLFGGDLDRVSTNKLAVDVGCAPSTLREWRLGHFPTALRIFARICRIRRLTPEQIAALVRSLE